MTQEKDEIATEFPNAMSVGGMEMAFAGPGRPAVRN